MEIRRDRLTAVCPALYSAILYVQRGSAYLSSCPGEPTSSSRSSSAVAQLRFQLTSFSPGSPSARSFGFAAA